MSHDASSLTVSMSLEEDGLCLEQQYNPVRVWAFSPLGRLGAQELISPVHSLKDVLHTEGKGHTTSMLATPTYPTIRVLVWMVFLSHLEIGLANNSFLVTKIKEKTLSPLSKHVAR